VFRIIFTGGGQVEKRAQVVVDVFGEFLHGHWKMRAQRSYEKGIDAVLDRFSDEFASDEAIIMPILGENGVEGIVIDWVVLEAEADCFEDMQHEELSEQCTDKIWARAMTGEKLMPSFFGPGRDVTDRFDKVRINIPNILKWPISDLAIRHRR